MISTTDATRRPSSEVVAALSVDPEWGLSAVEVEARAYSAGLAFVIDSTLSMDPYIDRTREAVKKIYDTLGDADLLGGVSFGLVAFRDNPDSAAPGLDYLTRTYVNLEQGRDAASFLSRVNSVRASTVSSRDFVEDAYAGVKQAIETLDWSPPQTYARLTP